MNKKNNGLVLLILWAVAMLGSLVGGVYLTNAIINSDLSDWWKWILLR